VPGGHPPGTRRHYFAGLQQQVETASPVREQINDPSLSTQQQDSTTVPVFSQTIRESAEPRAEPATIKARAKLPRSFFIEILQSNVGTQEPTAGELAISSASGARIRVRGRPGFERRPGGARRLG
jgi:hypothetical protein